MTRPSPRSAWELIFGFWLDHKPGVFLVLLVLVGGGVLVAPFDWSLPGVDRNPVPVDAIPDTGENQQVVFTEWPGRSPQDVEDQVTYPLTTALLGTSGVRTVRSTSMFGFSSVYVIFEDGVDFFWARARILEKLASLAAGSLPEGVQPTLGPEATSLGQVFWYTLEGRDEKGRPTGGWGLDELRSLQDWYVRYALSGVPGVAEVSSVGGHVREYQIDVDPEALRVFGVSLADVFSAVRRSNVDVGARTMEVNGVEYVIRGLGFLRELEDLEKIVVKVHDNVPVTVSQVARVGLGPAPRRGVLDRAGAEVVGGVVVLRYGENPLQVLERVKQRIAEVEQGLPRKIGEDGRESRVAIVPFYDRTQLIHETLDTLGSALEHESLITMIVVLLMVAHLGNALLIATLVPVSVLLSFLLMKQFGVQANIVALSGIAIAIGTIVDMGIVVSESVLRRLQTDRGHTPLRTIVVQGSADVGGAVLTSVLTTIVSFLPVFTMGGPEGKLFGPLAFTKTFALVSSMFVVLVVLPPAAHLVMRRRRERTVSGAGIHKPLTGVLVVLLLVLLGRHWSPLGPDRPVANGLFSLVVLGGVSLLFVGFRRGYPRLLTWCLAHQARFLAVPFFIVGSGLVVWLGADRVVSPLVPSSWEGPLGKLFPGLGREFMPRLDEGAFLLMPVTMPHASISEATDILQKQDQRIRAIPEVSAVVGKIGRVESALDTAPLSMIETLIQYYPEYVTPEEGPPFRAWRPHIRTTDDIWKEIEEAAVMPGVTRASMLQPIETRRIMLQTGLRATMGVKVFGPDLPRLEAAVQRLEQVLKQVPTVRAETVLADRVVAKPYLEINIDRDAIARHGLTIRDVQDVIEVAIGGKTLTTMVDGRERYQVRVRYQRELRDNFESLQRVLVAAPGGAQIPLGQLAEIQTTLGPQAIRSEDTFLAAYLTFDRQPGHAEVDVVEDCMAVLSDLEARGELALPDGIRYRFAGDFENQVRASRKLRVVLPAVLAIILLLLYAHFRSMRTSLLVFSGVFVAWAGGFWMIWLYGQDWFLDVSVFGRDLRELFQVRAINLSVAVWVGFLALFGIATDDGVILASYIRQSLKERKPKTREEIRSAVLEAGRRRIRPCLMTTATTVLALLPVLMSRGRGAEVMVPMAVPAFGGMVVVLISVFVVPTLYCAMEERRLARRQRGRDATELWS